MALWKISELNPAFRYWTCIEKPLSWFGRVWMDYPTRFCTGIKLYSESLSVNWKSAGHFTYVPFADKFYLYYFLDAGWITQPTYYLVYGINADGSGGMAAVAGGPGGWLTEMLSVSRRGIEVGSYGKLYCTAQSFGSGAIFEMDPVTLLPVIGGWALPYTDLPSFPAWGYVDAPGHSLVNREDGIVMLALNGSADMHFWNIGVTPHVYLGKMTAPGPIADISYEDRERFWLVTQNGYVAKINYQLFRTELLSELQDRAPTDINYLIAWDQARFRLAVFRHKPDAADGACTSTIEFYRPLPKADLLTDPVPIRPLRWGKRVPFSFHLVGTAGEGIAPYMVNAELQDPVEGALAQASLGTGRYGVGAAEYLAPQENCEETLTLTATITDGQES